MFFLTIYGRYLCPELSLFALLFCLQQCWSESKQSCKIYLRKNLYIFVWDFGGFQWRWLIFELFHACQLVNIGVLCFIFNLCLCLCAFINCLYPFTQPYRSNEYSHQQISKGHSIISLLYFCVALYFPQFQDHDHLIIYGWNGYIWKCTVWYDVTLFDRFSYFIHWQTLR